MALLPTEEITRQCKNLQYGEKFYLINDYDYDKGGMEAYYTRVSVDQVNQELARSKKLSYTHGPSSSIKFGTVCPRCGKSLIECSRSTRNDSFFGWDDDCFVCEDNSCGILRSYKRAGY